MLHSIYSQRGWQNSGPEATMGKGAKAANHSESSSTVQTDRTGLERLIFFSDAVFAIAITLLVIEIRLPPVEGSLNNAELAESLLRLWPNYLGYMISFLVIGAFWISHHRKFRYIQHYDSRLLLLNLLLLMAIAFMPFPTAVLSEYGNRTAIIFYAGAIVLIAVLLAVVWSYASYHNRLVDPQLDRHIRRREFVGPLLMAGIFLLSIPLAFINESLAMFSWLLLAVVWWFIR
jgi:uncharacterized membrane protein